MAVISHIIIAASFAARAILKKDCYKEINKVIGIN